MATVFLNGTFVGADDARVSAFDAGFQHGVGLFETMLALRDARGAHVLHLREHLNRLGASSSTLSLMERLHVGALEEAVDRAVARGFEEHADSARLRVRLTITGGDLNLLHRADTRPADPAWPTLLIVAQPATCYPSEMFRRGVLATIADWRANPFDPTQGHKTISYWPRLRELQAAAAKQAGEALVFTITNHLAGGCVSNAFVVRAGVLLTPIARSEEEEIGAGSEPGEDDAASLAHKGAGGVLPSPVLPGIVRRWVMDWALAEGVPLERRMITLDDVLNADEVFLTNSSWGVLPVTRVETRTIANGAVGAIAARLVAAWRDLAGGE